MALTKIKADGLTADLIDETKLADNSIDSEHYNDGSIDNAHLADDAVGVAELSATGTASSSTFLRGDNSWATPTDTNTVTTINSNADNRLITGSGTANTLNGESNLTFNGQKLNVVANDGGQDVNFAVRNTNATGFGAYISGGGTAQYILRLDNKDQSEKVRFPSAGGITFNGDTAAANALDDYEEGSWTPVMLDQNGSNYSIGITTADTYYTKVGRLVTCMFNITNNESGSKTGYLYFPASCFPFTAVNTQNGTFWVDHGSPTQGLGDIVGGIMNVGGSGAWFTKPTDESGMGTASTRYLEHGQWTNGRPIYGSFQYITS